MASTSESPIDTEARIKAVRKELRALNHVKLRQSEKIYYETHKQECMKRTMEYRKQHADEINARLREKVECPECHTKVAKQYIKKHQGNSMCQRRKKNGSS